MASTASNSYSHSMNFDRLYKSHYKSVRSIVKRFRFDDSIADDLVQDIFVKAWQSLDQLKVPEAFSGWLRTLARNKCLTEVRRVQYEIPTLMGDARDQEYRLNVEAPNPALALHMEESHASFLLLIEMHQDPIRREIATLFYMKQQPIKAIAEHLDMNSNTVLSHLRRFRLIATQALLELAEEKDWDLQACFQAVEH